MSFNATIEDYLQEDGWHLSPFEALHLEVALEVKSIVESMY